MALAALDRDTAYQAAGGSEDQAAEMSAEYKASVAGRNYVSRSWKVVMACPADWKIPADPRSLDRRELTRFSETEYLTIALFRLGGLHDVGAIRPLIPEPTGGGEWLARSHAYGTWWERAPIDGTTWKEREPQLAPEFLPPEVAEQMLKYLEEWVNVNTDREGVASGPSADRGGAKKLGTDVRGDRQRRWLAEAMLTVRDHPEWTDAAIARSVGIDRSRLSRSKEYKAAASLARPARTPPGSVTIADGNRTVEAVDDSFDPNRKASRQWQDEEDTDDRIDREMNATQRVTQRAKCKTPKNSRPAGA